MIKISARIFALIIIFLFIEFLSQIVIMFYKSNEVSFFFRSFVNIIKSKQANYILNWDYKNDRLSPGIYEQDGIIYKINSKGFRGEEYEFKKKKKRIIAFGGSTTIGLESPDDKTYPAQLEYLLKKNKFHYEVINMGMPSKSLNYIRKLYYREASLLEPDFIIIYSNRNSIMYDSGTADFIFNNNSVIKNHFFFYQNVMIYNLMSKVYKKIISLNLQPDRLKTPYHSKGINEAYFVYNYKNSLIELVNFAEKNNTKVVLVKMAYNFSEDIVNKLEKYSNKELIEKYKNNFFKDKYNFEEKALFWSLFGTILNNQIDELKNKKNVIVVNPINKLLRSSLNFTDYVHLSPKGNFVLASEIFQALKNYH